ATQIQLLLGWKPKKATGRRLSTLISVLADTGCRIDEALSLQWKDIDFDNLLVLLHGKGRKDRLVPMSLELRRRLFLFQRKTEAKEGLAFPTQVGTKQGRRNVLRDFKQLCRTLGFEPPARCIHAMRHTFAVNYLRKGGGVFHLQKMLGHSTLEMTRRYANLMTEDLQAIHQKVSLLAQVREKMETAEYNRGNRMTRHQTGYIFESKSEAFHVRYYTTEIVDGHAKRVQRSHLLCRKDNKYFSKTCKAVKLKRDGFMRTVNAASGQANEQDMKVTDFWEQHYLPFVQENMKPSTV